MSGFIGDLLEGITDFFIDVWMLRRHRGRHRAVRGRPSSRWDEDAATVVVFNGWVIAVSVAVLVASVVLFFVLKLPVWISLLPIGAGAVHVGYRWMALVRA